MIANVGSETCTESLSKIHVKKTIKKRKKILTQGKKSGSITKLSDETANKEQHNKKLVKKLIKVVDNKLAMC